MFIIATIIIMIISLFNVDFSKLCWPLIIKQCYLYVNCMSIV